MLVSCRLQQESAFVIVHSDEFKCLVLSSQQNQKILTCLSQKTKETWKYELKRSKTVTRVD